MDLQCSRKCHSHKKRHYCCIFLLETDFVTITEHSTDYLVGDLRSLSITCCFHFFPSSVFCQLFFGAFLNALCLSSSFLLITIHGCIPLCWPKTRSPKTCVIILEVLHFITKNTHSILSAPFLASAWFVTAKYCQT